MSKMISISDELKTIIDDIKDKEGHQSIDSLIREWKTQSDAYRVLTKELSKKEQEK